MTNARPLRIAFIAPYPATALLPPEAVKAKYLVEHPATWVRALACGMTRRDDVELRVICDSRAVTRRHELRSEGATYIFLPKREPIRTDPLHDYRPGAARIRRELAQRPPDLVVGFGIEGGCARLAIRQPYPSVVFIQGIIELTAEYRDILPIRLRAYLRDERRALFDANALVAETAFARDWARRQNPRAKIALIPHAMDTAFLENRPTLRDPVALCIGSLNRIKDPETVIRAFASVPRADARLVMIGEGELRAEMERLASALGIADRTSFAGHLSREQIMRHMANARFVVLGSRMDTSPNVLTEAHAAGLPVVATRTGGIPDMVSDGYDGLLAPVGDAPAMAVCMKRLLDDPEQARAMGAAGREKVRTLNDPDRVAAQHVEFYRGVVRCHAARRLRNRTISSGMSRNRIARRLAGALPPSILLGASYRYWKRFLAEAQHWPRERIDEWQIARFREMVRHAYTHTEGYRELYRKAGLEPDDIRTQSDILRVPMLTKEVLRDNLDDFSIRSSRREYGTTGGSTGIPLGFYYARPLRSIERAFMHASWEWAGWKPGARSAVLRGGYVGATDRIAEYDPLHRELLLSSYFLMPDTLPAYLEALRRYRIRVLQAYPSSLNLFCDLLREQGRENDVALDLVLLGSENIYDWQMEKFRAIFPRTRFFAWYGQAEQVTLAPWCEHTTRYHSRPFYGMTEILDANGQIVPDGSEGEIVGTNFHNLITPFIRYRTNDFAVRGGIGCPHCKRPFLIMDRILGRAQEFILTGTGRLISMTAINMHDDIFDGIRQFRFRQEQPGRVIFQYIPAGPLREDRLARIRSGLSVKFGTDVELELRQVAEIPRSSSGKLHFLDQQLPIRYHHTS